MPDIGAVMKAEISRLSRKEARRAVESSNKASAQHRRQIAELNRTVRQLAQEVARLRRNVGRDTPAAPAGDDAPRLRFVAKGFRAHRAKLGLSAADYGRLLGVSAQSVYNWERSAAVPRREQLVRIAALRGIGKREAASRLNGHG